MADFTTHPIGSPCWVDLMSPDTDAAKGFFAGLFGWDADDQFDPEGNYIYTNLSKDGKTVAGMGAQPPEMAGMPAAWNTYIAVDDPAVTAEKVTAAGGSVLMPPMQVMEHGSMAVFADPAGAAISVWKAEAHVGARVGNEPDTWSWNELMTRDLGAVKPFYAAVFGWDYDEMDMGPMGTYHVVKGGDSGWAGLMTMPPDMPEQVPNHWMVYFTVSDIEASVAKVTGNGGGIASGPMAIPGIGTSAVVHHPAGGSFSMMEPVSSD